VVSAAARAFRMPRWKAARRSCAWAADRAGTGGGGAAAALTVPGTRFALGTRTGSPAAVVPADTGACATSAACHPASAGDDQVSVGAAVAGRSAPCLLRRNQSDSTDSKIGSRVSSAALGTGGTITSGRGSPAGDGTAASSAWSPYSWPASTAGSWVASTTAAAPPGGAPSTGGFPFSGAGAVVTAEPAGGMAGPSAGLAAVASVANASNRRNPGRTAVVS